MTITLIFLFNIVPQIPSGFNITRANFTPVNNTITFEWDPPQGMGPEVIVDYYLIFITPAPLSHPILNNVSSSPWDVTVNYNTLYSVNITALNCAGKSGTFVFSDFLYGMLADGFQGTLSQLFYIYCS